MKYNKSILIFGAGQLQQSLIEGCRRKGLFAVGIDPNPNAECRSSLDAFEVVAPDDFEKTLAVAQKYSVAGVITAATDKPLIMMARVSERLNIPFFSVETAEVSTDKFLMKQKFMEAGLPCAKGYLIADADELCGLDLTFPIIVKPRDNSGSRGVVFCESIKSATRAVEEALMYTKKCNVLVEEFIEGLEYSIEGIHYDGEHHVIQFTEKTTTDFPYNVEIAHIQPADISIKQQNEIRELISKIAQKLGFDNCASHTEIKINSKGIYIIETSPRLGGDFISSTLVPLSTGINMENILIDLSTNNIQGKLSITPFLNRYAGIRYFSLTPGRLKTLGKLDISHQSPDIVKYHLFIKPGDIVKQIKSSIDRYGYAIISTENKEKMQKIFDVLAEFESKCEILEK